MIKPIKESDETKRKILLAAKKEFAEKGFSGARMSSIASIAGVNQALLHYHFESKENLYISIFQNSIGDIPDKFAKKLFEEITSWDGDSAVELAAAIYIMVGINLDTHDDELHRIFAREIAEGKGIIHEFVKKYMMPRILLFESIIKNGVKKGIFETSSTTMFSFNVVVFISDFAHGEEFLRDTELHNELYSNKKETLYNYMTEMSFKALKPADKDLKIPVLDEKKREKLDLIIREMSDDLMLL